MNSITPVVQGMYQLNISTAENGVNDVELNKRKSLKGDQLPEINDISSNGEDVGVLIFLFH